MFKFMTKFLLFDLKEMILFWIRSANEFIFIEFLNPWLRSRSHKNQQFMQLTYSFLQML